MRMTHLRNTVLATILLVSGTLSAHAATVFNWGETGAITSTSLFDKKTFSLPDPGSPGFWDVSVTLKDLSSGPFIPFSTLGSEVATSTQIWGVITQPGTFSFNLAPAGSYDVWTLGTTSGVGLYGVTVNATFSPVPLPASVLLMGSAFIGLIGLSRRRRSR